MSRPIEFRRMVMEITGGSPKNALSLGDYLTKMGITYPMRRASARAQLTRAMKPGGPLRDLVDKGLVLADVANRQPECFSGVDRRPATLPVVIEDGPVADLRTFPKDSLTDDASDARNAVVVSLSTVRMPVRAAETIARDVGKILFDVERQKLRADAAERECKLQAEHVERVEKMYDSLVKAIGMQKQAAE